MKKLIMSFAVLAAFSFIGCGQGEVSGPVEGDTAPPDAAAVEKAKADMMKHMPEHMKGRAAEEMTGKEASQ